MSRTIPKRKLLFVSILITAHLFLLTGLYLGTITWRSREHYIAYKERRWSSTPVQWDEVYGFVPNRHGPIYYRLEDGKDLPMIIDEHGLRVSPAGEPSLSPNRSRILFLGCSVTYGLPVPAEKTFACITAEKLKCHPMNAGFIGWGLSQMLLRARELIPEWRPDYVVAQYSDWLPERSMGLYTPGFELPTAYFYNRDGAIAVHPPVFRAAGLTIPVDEQAGGSLLSFVRHVGMPLFLHDDYSRLTAAIRLRLGRIPVPMKCRQRVVDYSYGEINRLCTANNGKLIVLAVPGSIHQRPKDRLDSLPCRIVFTLEKLIDRLPEATQEAWQRHYCCWGGKPSRIVDRHPNAEMHAAVSEILVEAILNEREHAGDP